jgi:hypothetical protein
MRSISREGRFSREFFCFVDLTWASQALPTKGASLSERTRVSQIAVLTVRSKPRHLKTATGCTALEPVHIRDFADGFDFAELRGFDRGGILCSLK